MSAEVAPQLQAALTEHARWLETEGEEGEALDLSGQDLRGLDLAGADLRDADLTDVLADGTDLRRARLDGALLTGASLRGARLMGAWLPGMFFRGVDLRGADLRASDLSDSLLTETDLRGARLEGAVLDDALLDTAVVTAGLLGQVGSAEDLVIGRLLLSMRGRTLSLEADRAESSVRGVAAAEEDRAHQFWSGEDGRHPLLIAATSPGLVAPAPAGDEDAGGWVWPERTAGVGDDPAWFDIDPGGHPLGWLAPEGHRWRVPYLPDASTTGPLRRGWLLGAGCWAVFDVEAGQALAEVDGLAVGQLTPWLDEPGPPPAR